MNYNSIKKIKYPKYLKLKAKDEILTEKEINFVNDFSDNFEFEFKKVNISELKQSLFSLEMDKNSTSYFKIINSLSTPEYLENDIPLDKVQKTFEENLGFNDEKYELEKIFDKFESYDTKDMLISLNDMKKLMNHINIDFDEDELKNMLSECSQDGNHFTFEDFCLLMAIKDI